MSSIFICKGENTINHEFHRVKQTIKKYKKVLTSVKQFGIISVEKDRQPIDG